MKLSGMLDSIEPQLARRLYDKAKTYNNVIDLTLGDPDFSTPPAICAAGCQAILSGKTKYTANAGLLELRAAISEDIERRLGIKYDPETEIICTIGAMGALYLATICSLDPDDEMIVLAPHWPNYTNMIKMCYGKPVYIDSYGEKHLSKLSENLENSVTAKTKAIILNTPSNPTGQILSGESLQIISEFAKKYDLTVFSDEVYHTIIFDEMKHESILQFDGMKERTVLIDSLSKRFSMTGWRVGFAAAPREMINYMVQLNEDVAACVPMFVQHAAVEALKNGREAEKAICNGFYERCRYMTKRLNDIPGITCKETNGTFYLFVDISKTGLTSEQFAFGLLEHEQVAVVPGNAFNIHGEGYIRIACTVDIEKLSEAADRILRYVSM